MSKLICQKCGSKENATNKVNICSNCEKIKRLEQAKIICRAIGLTVLIMFIPLLIFPILKGTNSSGYYELPVEVGKSIFSYRVLVLANILLILLAVISFSLFIFFKLKIKNISKAICFLLFFALTIPLSAQSKSKDVLLFEIKRYSNPGSGGMGLRRSSTDTFFFYQSGRIACKSLSYDLRGKEVRGNKSKCFHISQTKIAELTGLAEQADFLPTEEVYKFFRMEIDAGKSFTITYFAKNGEKTIKFANPIQSKEKVPLSSSLKMFLQKISEIDKTMKVYFEF